MCAFTDQVAACWGLRLTPAQAEAFAVYERELLDWNARFNLTAIRDPEGIRLKHFLDSLALVSLLRQRNAASLIDVGTGAGFPGLAVKIALPSLQVTLVESVGKKAGFCRHMAGVLGMRGVEVMAERAESLGQRASQRERHDVAVARAVAALPVLAEYLLPLVRVGGCMVAMKDAGVEGELAAAGPAIARLGGDAGSVIPVTLPGIDRPRCLVVIEKVAPTPRAYPRLPGVPAKTPLLT